MVRKSAKTAATLRGTFICAAVRSPIGRRGADLAQAHAPTLLGAVMEAAVQRAGVGAERVDQVLAGCVTQDRGSGLQRRSDGVADSRTPRNRPGHDA